VSCPPVSECPVSLVRLPSGSILQDVQEAPPGMASPTVDPLLVEGLAAQLSVAVQAWVPAEQVVAEALGFGLGAGGRGVPGVGFGRDVAGRVVAVGGVIEGCGGDRGVGDLGVGEVPGVRIVGVGDVGVAGGGADLFLGDLEERGVGDVLGVGGQAAQPGRQVEPGLIPVGDGLRRRLARRTPLQANRRPELLHRRHSRHHLQLPRRPIAAPRPGFPAIPCQPPAGADGE
jgi:hypothetical protein